MKLADLRLNTVYADYDGRPLMVLSLDKVAKPDRTFYGGAGIRDIAPRDRSFGVVILRHAYAFRLIDLAEMRKVAAKFDTRPEKVHMVGEYWVDVEVIRNIVGPWEEHLARQQAEAERRAENQRQAAQERDVRATHIERITAQLPEGIKVEGMRPERDFAQIRLVDLATLLQSAQPTALGPGPSFTPRERALLAAGWDAAVSSLTYEDGTPVEVVATTNPYR